MRTQRFLAVLFSAMSAFSSLTLSTEAWAEKTPQFSQSATQTEPVLFAGLATIHSDILNEDRAFLLRVPPTAKPSGDKKLDVTVIYVLDADKHFASAAAFASFFEQSRLSSLGPSVVVGVLNTDRTRDFTPTASNAKRDGTIEDGAVPVGGGAKNFLAFLTGELRLAAEKRLPPEMRVSRRVLIGHSFGGLLTLYALFNEPKSFDTYVNLDPSLWWDQGQFARWAETKTIDMQANLARLYVALATRPRKGNALHTEQSRHFESITASLLKRQGVDTIVKFFPEEVHGTVAPPAMFDALKLLFASPKTPPA